MNVSKGSYAIAYADKNGNGFSQNKPWILDEFDDDIQSCISEAKKLITEGYKNVVVFQFGKRKREDYSWKYVNQRSIKFDGNDMSAEKLS